MFAILYSEFPYTFESKELEEFPRLKTKVLGTTDTIETAQKLLNTFAIRLIKMLGGYNKSTKAYISEVDKDKMKIGLSLYRKDANTIEIYERVVEIEPAYLWGNYTYEKYRKYGYIEIVESGGMRKTITYDDCIKELSEFLDNKYEPKKQKMKVNREINNHIKRLGR